MSKPQKICVFFSTMYPYETTLKEEFKVMSDKFDIIYYFPTHISEKQPELPENVKLIDKLANIKPNVSITNIIGLSFKFITLSLNENNKLKYIYNWKTYMSILALNIEYSKRLEKFIHDKQLYSAFFYDYWMENATLGLCLLKRKKIIKKLHCRAHGFDVYDNRWKSGVLPFRNFKVKYLTQIHFISKHGLNYTKNKVKAIYFNKFTIDYLGVNTEIQKKNNLTETNKKEKMILSVSNTQEFKRVHWIPDLLIDLPYKIKWIHFGKGPCDKSIKHKIKNLPENITVQLMGHCPNSEIFKFYQDNDIDLFASLSTNEGIPISMMEAMSFGVPVFSAAVNGIPELVKKDCGLLFEKNSSLIEIKNCLDIVLNRKFSKSFIKNHAINNFDIKKNLNDFYAKILDT